MKTRSSRWEDILKDFKEYKDEDYFKLLQDTFEKSNTEDACTIARETKALSGRLKCKKTTYNSTPFSEGYCMGLFTPHRDRIDRMVNAVDEEANIMQQECEVQLQDKKDESVKEDKQREYKLKCDTIALDYARLETSDKALQASPTPRKK